MNKECFILTIALVAGTILAGCCIYKGEPLPPTKYYYITGDKDLSTVGRVDIIELANGSSDPQISGEISRSLFQSLQKEQMFGLRLFALDDPQWTSLQLAPDATYSLEQLNAMRDTLKSDAVVTGTVTDYRPFPHTSMSLRLRMIDLRDGKLLWAVDHTWDTQDKQLQERISRYFKSQMRSGYAPLREDLVTISPIEFNKFVAYEVVQTLDSTQ